MYIGYFTGVTKVEAPDDLTVVITSSKPNAVLTALYVPILPEHVWSQVADNKTESTVTPQQPPTAAAPAQPTRVTSERVEAPAPNPTDVRPA